MTTKPNHENTFMYSWYMFTWNRFEQNTGRRPAEPGFSVRLNWNRFLSGWKRSIIILLNPPQLPGVYRHLSSLCTFLYFTRSSLVFIRTFRNNFKSLKTCNLREFTDLNNIIDVAVETMLILISKLKFQIRDVIFFFSTTTPFYIRSY